MFPLDFVHLRRKVLRLRLFQPLKAFGRILLPTVSNRRLTTQDGWTKVVCLGNRFTCSNKKLFSMSLKLSSN